MHFFNHKICVCAHLTQACYAQRTCAEMGIKMQENTQFKRQLCDEILRLESLKKTLEERLQDAPSGKLRIQRTGSGNYTQYYIADATDTRKYLPKNQFSTAQRIAQKGYDEKVKVVIGARVRDAKRLLNQYDKEIGDIYTRLSQERRKLVTPLMKPDEDFIEEWYQKYSGNANPYPNSFPIVTERGETVRSKSEKILADLFYKHQIPYIYEPQIIFQHGKAVYPDFLILNVSQRNTYVFEHFGMMDNPEYAQGAIEKISLYEENNYWYGDNLLYSMETSTRPLNIKNIEAIVRRYLK